MERKYYAYKVPEGNREGVTEDWGECERMVKGVKGSRFKSFKVKADAEAWLAMGAEYSIKKEAQPGIYFDAGTGRGNGVEIRVTDETGKNLLETVLPKSHVTRHGTHGLFGATNNFGELLACKYTLQIAIKDGVRSVYGDSKLVLEYWSKGYVSQGEVAEETIVLSKEVAGLRKQFEGGGGTMAYVSGDDNPADLGFHR